MIFVAVRTTEFESLVRRDNGWRTTIGCSLTRNMSVDTGGVSGLLGGLQPGGPRR